MGEGIVRVVRRRAKPGCEEAYEALIRAMFAQARQFPGYVSMQLIPPDSSGGEYQIIQQFASEADLDNWTSSNERALWQKRLRPVADNDPEYRLLNGLDAWFAPAEIPAHKPPPRWKMTIVSWLGIFPTVAILLWLVAPALSHLPFLIRTGIFTALVAIAMSYVVMPRVSRWMAWWIKR